jgi:ATP-dependent Clp protease protease subunit
METFIRFMAPVNGTSATTLMKCIDEALSKNVDHIHLMLSSPGGSVFHGLSIHNFLKGSPVDVTTYNFGTVDSIATVIFCAGSTRRCVPHARFLIHGVSLTFEGTTRMDEIGLEEHLKLIKIDYENIARVIADTTGKSTENIVKAMNDRTTLSPMQAKDYGLVHEISSDLFPKNSELMVIMEDNTARQVTPGCYQLPLITQHQSSQLPKIESNSTALSTGSYW